MDNRTNTHTDNLSLELFRFERGVFIALFEKILEVLNSPNNLSQFEKEFWLNRARLFHGFASDINESVNKFKDALENQTKAENAYLN